MKEKILLFWSGGKKSALALDLLLKNPSYEVAGLISIFDKETNRIPFHGIPDSLILEQAKLLKLPLQRIFLSSQSTQESKIEQIRAILNIYTKKGIVTQACGHLDKHSIQNQLFFNLGSTILTPNSELLSDEFNRLFLNNGFKALVSSVNLNSLDQNFLAFEYNEAFLDRLPGKIDKASRGNEFHTFVIFGPNFSKRVAFSKAIAVNEGDYLVSLVKEP